MIFHAEITFYGLFTIPPPEEEKMKEGGEVKQCLGGEVVNEIFQRFLGGETC